MGLARAQPLRPIIPTQNTCPVIGLLWKSESKFMTNIFIHMGFFLSLHLLDGMGEGEGEGEGEGAEKGINAEGTDF